MSLAWPTLFRAPRNPILFLRQTRSLADFRPFAPGDLVLLRKKLDRSAPPTLTRPLKPGGKFEGHHGIISHDDIIGKQVRDVVHTQPVRSGRPATAYRLHEVKLEEYVRLSRRLVTPIYPADARLIVELFDLHIQPFHTISPDVQEPKLEILEAGTGHGALTLYLSRAIHAANPAIPVQDAKIDQETNQARWAEWKASRRAIIHSIDSSPKYSPHAAKVVKGFKRGMYYHNVDFHVADVGAWTQKTLAERDDSPFLSHAFLDLPRAEAHLSTVAKALRTDGCLVVFNPSISQIMDSVRKIHEERIPLELETVIELGVNGGSAGREWNVRAVKPRTKEPDGLNEIAQEEKSVSSAVEDGVLSEQDAKPDDNDEADQPATDDAKAAQKWSMICRPKVGERIIGGGFLGVWRKHRDMPSPQ